MDLTQSRIKRKDPAQSIRITFFGIIQNTVLAQIISFDCIFPNYFNVLIVYFLIISINPKIR